jgi:hypothetical protein
MLSGAPRKAAQAGLIALMALGALALWLGSPALWLWIGSQLTQSQTGEFGPYALVAVGILGTTILLAFGLARLQRAYERLTDTESTVRMRLPWMRSLRDEREAAPRVTVLDLILC